MLKITPGSVVSDGHVVLIPAGLSGEVTLADGSTVDLGPAHQVAIEVDSHEHAQEVAFLASEMAAADPSVDVAEHDAALSRKNLDLPKKG